MDVRLEPWAEENVMGNSTLSYKGLRGNCTLTKNWHVLWSISKLSTPFWEKNKKKNKKQNKMVREPNVSPHKQIIKDDDVKECISIE